jgi:uncharacterized membrane protein YdjX (TVP38/TMEM64 family)
MTTHGRTLRPLSPELVPEDTPTLASSLADPDGPLDEALAKLALPDEPLRREARRRAPRALSLLLGLLALAAVWAWTPLGDWIEPGRLAQLADPLGHSWQGAVVAVVVIVVATLLMVPVTALIVMAALLFGPWLGGAVAFCGSILGAIAGYGLGRALLRDTVRKLAGKRLSRLSRALAARGVLAVVTLRVVPVAPFTIVNLVAGSSHVRLRDFLLGTIIGMAPGVTALSLAADRVALAARSPSAAAIAIAGALLVVVVAALHLLHRWLDRTTTHA